MSTIHPSKHNPDDIRNAFRFLVDEFGYEISQDEVLCHDDRPYGFVLEYAGHNRRVHLSHDYAEEFLNFLLIRGLNTRYPNDHDLQNIVPFWGVFRSFEPSLELKSLQPEDQTCAEAVRVNAELLRKYCSDILLGKAWIY
jgi:hypothetical protein